MTLRSGPQGNFTDSVCDVLYPAGASGAHVGAIPLPPVPRAPARIVVFGDSGCRLKGAEVQACNDPQRWPFAPLVRAMAALHPDLVIDVGDYYYRETPCPASGVDCSGSPYGDRTESWDADYFVPVAPLFATAPFIHVRGNHEDCKRSPYGWARYLSGTSGGDVHRTRSAGDDRLRQPASRAGRFGLRRETDRRTLFVADEEYVDAHAGNRETWLATHRPPVAYLGAHGRVTPTARTWPRSSPDTSTLRRRGRFRRRNRC